jgi:hypothetical protein
MKSRGKNCFVNFGGVTEWTKVPVLKTGVSQGTVSSNLTPTARCGELAERLNAAVSKTVVVVR